MVAETGHLELLYNVAGVPFVYSPMIGSIRVSKKNISFDRAVREAAKKRRLSLVEGLTVPSYDPSLKIMNGCLVDSIAWASELSSRESVSKIVLLLLTAEVSSPQVISGTIGTYSEGAGHAVVAYLDGGTLKCSEPKNRRGALVPQTLLPTRFAQASA